MNNNLPLANPVNPTSITSNPQILLANRAHRTLVRSRQTRDRYRLLPEGYQVTPGRNRHPGTMVGNTPVLWIPELSGTSDPDRGFWAKLEGFNPGGMKDCVAVFTIGYSCASRGADSWLIRRCSVVQGCLDDPGATVEAIDDDGWPHTGDPCSPNSAASGKYGERPASVSTGDIHSLVIASDYRVPDPGRVWPLLQRNKSALADIGAHHVLIYASTHDSGRVLVMIGVRSREPIVELLRSRVFFDWFDAMGVDDIPAVFAGEIVDRFVAAPTTTQSTPRVPGVVVAAFASVNNVSNLTAEVRSAIARFTAAGIRKTWVFQAFDDAHEVLILQEFADEAGARQWIEHPDAAAEWMSGAGVGAYPPLFVGRFFDMMRIEALQ